MSFINMIIISVIILILTIAAGLDLNNIQYDNETSEVVPYSVIMTNGYVFIEDSEEATFRLDDGEDYVESNNTTKNETFRQMYAHLKPFFNEVRTCRQSYPELTNITFRTSLFCFLLSSQYEITPDSDFYCNISKEFIDDLKDKLDQIPYFRDIAELHAKYNCCEHSVPEKSTEDQSKYVVIEDNLKLKLEDEWLQLESKIPHMSHIYLGTSKFPILTEESRILEKGTSLISPSSTQRSFIRETTFNEKERGSSPETTTFENIYRWLKPYRWEKSHTRVSKDLSKLKKNRLRTNNSPNSNPEFVFPPIWSGALTRFPTLNNVNTTESLEPQKNRNLFQKGMDYIRSTFSKFLKKPANV